MAATSVAEQAAEAATAPLMAVLTATAVVVAAATRGHFATAATAVAIAVTAAKDIQQSRGIGLRTDTHQTDRQRGGQQTILHGRLLK